MPIEKAKRAHLPPDKHSAGTCGFVMGDAADGHKVDDEQESRRQSSPQTLHLDSTWDNRSNTPGMAAEGKKEGKAPPPVRE